MADAGKVEHRLIAKTPLTLLALTRHQVEPHEKLWFARCRADYLRSFPLTLLELVRLLMLLSLVGPLTNISFSLTALVGWSLVCSLQAIVRRKEASPGLDEKRALRNRAGVIKLRAIWWMAMLGWAILIVPSQNVDTLVALGFAMMVIDGLSTMSLPHVALGASVGGGLSLTIALFLRDGWDAAPLATIALVTASFMHWSIYNLYYMFATRRIRTRRLRESHETIQLVLNQYDDEGSDWLYELDDDLCVHTPSPRFCNACGIEAGELEGRSLIDVLGTAPEVSRLRELLEIGQPFRNVVVPVRVDGAERWWSLNGRQVEGVHGEKPGWRGFIADISVAKQAEAQVTFMAHYDLLTKLPNRTLLNSTLDRAFTRMSREEIVGLLYVDLDHFKAINDGQGHAMGDKVLAEVAHRLENVVRPRDMVARLGGDEFIVLMPHLESTNAGLIVAERVLEVIGNSLEIDGQILPIGASIGVAFAPHDASTGDELLRAADLAMYNVKSRGRRGISIFNSEMQTQMLERRTLEIDLRAAIVRQELELHYQPLLHIETGEVAGYEALLRWNHPTRGLVQPNTFISIAEETGVIVEIGNWVIRTALSEAANWPEDVTVAVNMSPTQIKDDNLLATVVNALAATGVAPERLELEITENLLMQESDEVLAVLHKLRDLGVKIALDDFGTGYSSLNYLRSFPFDKIKIDRCFVSELAENEDCQAIVRSVIGLANELGMTTTAEGVEAAGQLAALRAQGCDQAQGFLFSKAVPVSELHFTKPNPAAKRA